MSTKENSIFYYHKKQMFNKFKNNSKIRYNKNIWVFIIIVFAIVTLFQTYKSNISIDGNNLQIIKEEIDVPLNIFLEKYKNDDFSKIDVINDSKLIGYVFLGTGEGTDFMLIPKKTIEERYNVFKSEKPISTSLTDLGINIQGKTQINIKTEKENFIDSIISDILPLIIFFGLFLLVMRFSLPKGGLPFVNKTGKDNMKTNVKTRFKDVAGMEEVKEELSEVVDYLKNPGKYHKVGARHPKGILLYGQPGSGKTLLARAIAGEASVPFFSVSGSEFMEMLVGMGAAKVRSLFQKAKAAGRAIIFIDEIDAIGRKRGLGHTGGHQEQEQTLNQILTEMDGFDNKTNIIVIAATNRPDILDPALLRAGRFDRKILVSAPTYEERKEIFNYYLKDKKVSKEVDLDSLIKRTSGLVGADIENIVNEAALKVARDGKNVLGEKEFEYALEKVLMGPEKKIKKMKEQERKIIAYHELGHAVTSHLLEEADNVEKITIVRRGDALGATRKIPEEDKYLYSKKKILEETISLLGGRAAEEVFFGKENITTGASNDFKKATKMISDMIMKYGMDEEIGLITFSDESKEGYIPYKPYSEKTAEEIDKKIKKYMSYCYSEAKRIITKNKTLINKLSKILLDKEYLSKKEFMSFMNENLSSK